LKEQAQLRQILDNYFNEAELNNLCFDLNIDYESLSSGGKADKARELVAHCKRHGRIDELEQKCRQLRPLAFEQGEPASPPLSPAPIHENLPHQPYFFGREEELLRIADALNPEFAGWGVLIDGAGGIGKTSLAIRAGHLAPNDIFPIKIFLSAKIRELTPKGEQKLEDFMLPNYMVLLAELARELGEGEIAKCNPNERANEVRRALTNQHALIIIDNLETFEETERERLFQFLRRLPRTCKAIVTSRRRSDVAAEIIRLDRLTPEAAHALIAKIAERRPPLARAGKDEWDLLYQTAGGNPLLIEWIAGQLGREGSRCRTVKDACDFVQAAPPGNDPLEYIFGDLLDTFTESETAVLAALAHFTLPAKTKWIAEMTALPMPAAQTALEDLTDRALVTSDAQFETFLLPKLAITFLQRKRPEVIAQTGERLVEHVFALVLENGYRNYERFPVLEAEWSAIAAALRLFLQGDNARLQRLFHALNDFLNYSGRWDERLNVALQAEKRAIAANDLDHAGWGAYSAGMVYFLRGEVNTVLDCAHRAEMHWTNSSAREKAYAIRLRGWGHRLQKNNPAAIAAFQEAVDIWRKCAPDSWDVVTGLDSLTWAEYTAGDYASAERHAHEALEISRKMEYRGGEAGAIGFLAVLALDCEDWTAAETLAQEALSLAEEVGLQEYTALNSSRLAKARARQGHPTQGLPYARRAVEILDNLRSPSLEKAQVVLKECEEGIESLKQ